MAFTELNTALDTNGLLDTIINPARIEKLNFKYFPPYAQFLLEHKLEEFAAKLLQLSREVNLPLLKLFQSYTEEQLIQLGIQSVKNSLTFFAANKGRELIEHSVKMWLNNEIPMISRDAIVADDITLVSFIRRKAFRDFLPFYTNEFAAYRNIMEEIDQFTTELETVSLNLLLSRQQGLYKQAQALAHIGNWVWDLEANKFIWSDEMYKIYELKPGTEIALELIGSYNHPDDHEYATQQMKLSAETHKPHDFFYRIILKDGREKVLHAKGQLLVNASNEPVQFFGTLQDVTKQKHSENELAEKRNFIQKITDFTPSLITAYNVKTGKYIFINNALKKLLGYDPQEPLDKGTAFFWPLIHPDDFEPLMKKNAKAIERANQPDHRDDSEIIAEFQYRLRHKNGEYRWFHTYGTIFNRDRNGQVECALNISVDVTQQYLLNKQLEEEKISAQKNEEELKRSEERYHRMIAEVQDYAILMLDKDGIIQNWNLGAEKIKGYRAEEILGKNFRVFYTEEDRQNHRPEKLLKQAIETGKANDEGWRVRKDRTQFWASIVITALHDEDNNIIGFSKVTRDLTKRKESEEMTKEYANELFEKNEELRRSEERYHRMITEVQDYAILMLDKDGIVQNWNLGAEKIKGYKADEIVGKNFRLFYTEEDRQNHRPEKLLKQAIETGRANDEGWRVRKDGTRFWGSVVITALHDENSNVIGFSKVTRDLTEQKLAGEKLKKYAEELEQKNEELIESNKDLESFNYVASHDLQEPLHKIQVFSDAILSNDFKSLSERGQGYFNKIFSAANRMQQLIEDLLAFSRATSYNAEFENTDLNILLDEVLATIHLSIEESQAVIESEDLPVARIIPFQFRQVLQNLISNSIKYSKAGIPPYIKISAKKVTTKNNSRELRPNYKYLVLAIADKGIGFDQQYAEKIFELFQRLHTKEEYPGTGIGLAIVKKIIQNHHGIIKAKSSPGNGATFEIYIPQEAE